MRPANNVKPQAILPYPSSHRRTLPIKRADAEPLSREDIQYDLLAAIFNDQHAAFTDQSPEASTSSVPKKVLREKMSETPEFAIDFAKIALLANVGRINTTMAFFPEMRTVLRSYHPIPSLQKKTNANLQDAPRIKNCLKACLLPGELSDTPSTPADILSKGQSGVIPTTSVVNLIFVLSNHSVPISKTHFETPFDFLDLFLPVHASSSSRARAFLWLMFHYLEDPSADNPFADDYSRRHPDKIPKLEMLTTQQRAMENVDTEDEIQYGRRMAQYRSKFLQKQIADEEKDKHVFADGLVKADFKITTPGVPGLKFRVTPDMEIQENDHEESRIPLEVEYENNERPDEARRHGALRIRAERTMLEHAWHMAISTDPLLNSDEEMDSEHVLIDCERRLRILNYKVRGKEVTPEPQVNRVRVPGRRWYDRHGYEFNG